MTSGVPANDVQLPWGNVDTDVFAAWGQWAGGIGSIAAVIVALALTIRESRSRRKEQLENRQAQAATVTSSIKKVSSSGGGFYSSWTSVVISNHGIRPILDVRIEKVSVVDDDIKYTKWKLSNDNRDDDAPHLLTQAIGPQDEVATTGIYFDDDGKDFQPGKTDSMEVTFTFLDAEGARWRRTGYQMPIIIPNLTAKKKKERIGRKTQEGTP